MASAEPPRPARKVQKACERCRAMKVKCSGTNPCMRCSKRNRRCHYVEDTRVSVPESYLRELERRHSPALYNRARHVLQTEDHPPAQDRPRSRYSRNPLTETEFWYMGPSSSWSFCRRVLALLGEQVPEANNPPDPWNIDGTAFMLKWRPLPADETPDLMDLPPMDYELHLLHTVRFHFGPLFYIVDEAAFIRDLHHFYTNSEDHVGSMQIWFAQYLLIIAFGKAFLAPNRQPNAPPDGHQYASWAMALMPDMSGLHSDQLQSIQALALAALYFQSVDMRVAAFQHIGFALRVCIIEGIHRHVPEHLNCEALTRRCMTLFWMVYMLDRDFSALIGAPSSIRDEDITVKLFAEGSVEEKTLILHVQLARSSARILTKLSQDLNDLLKTHFHGSLSRASRAATRLILAYHHCVVLTTRRLVIEPQTPTYSSTTPNHLAIPLSPVVSSLLHCCVESAQTVLQTLRTLADSDRIEAFLPFQIEDAFASTFLLHIISVIAPTLAPEETWLENADFVLDVLVRKGNLAAPLRKVELECLRRVERPLTLANANANSSVVRGEGGSESGNTAIAGAVGGNGRMTGVVPGPDEELDWDIFTVNATVGLEPQELFELADQLDIQGVMNMQYVAGLPP
ncbi:hypothetical protein BDW72DRAFT_200202 [Aspergillus terricola var. indicus]